MQSVSSRAAETAPKLHAVAAAVATESAYPGYQIIRRNGAVVAFEPNKIAIAMMKAFLAVHGAQGAASASVRETVDDADRGGRARAAALASGRRHLPHRGHAGPGRARPDARRRPRGRARLRAVPRAPLAGARQAGRRTRPAPAPTLHVHRQRRSACRSTSSALQGADRIGLRRPGRRRRARADPGRDACATCTTACRSTRCTRRPSWPRAR